jgi:pSer/pThr/pTyr-binding forkhead associated (FHA) protein
MAQGKPSPGEPGAKRAPKTSTRVHGSGRASPMDQAPARPADEDMDELFVDAAPASKKASRAADRRRQRGRAPPPAGVPDTRTSLPQREQAESQLSELNPKSFARATLVCTRGPEEGLSLNLIEGSYTIGRARENSFVLKDIAASRRHLRIEVDGAGARVVDMGSGNGTRVNGRRVSEHELKHGDRIEIGGSVLVFQEKGKSAVPADGLDDAQERVIRAAEKLAAELSGRVRFGDESQAGYEDGHAAKTQHIPKEAKEKLNAEIKRQQDRGAAMAAPPNTQGARSEQLWNETFTNLPLDKVVPADEPLRGPRAAEAAPPPPRPKPRAPLPRPTPLPLPALPDEAFHEELEPSASVSRGGSFFLSLAVSALVVVVVGGILIGAWALATRSSADDKAAEVVEQDFARAMAMCQQAFKAGDWPRAYEYATAALQLRPGDPMATTYQRDARERIEAATRAPPAPEPAPAEPAPPAPPAPASPAPASAPASAAPASAAPASAAPASAAPAPAVAVEPPPAVAPPPAPKQRTAPPREISSAPAPKPKPLPRKPARGLSDEVAEAKFYDAVNAMRDKDMKKGCRILEDIADKAAADSRWKEKAENLYSRRCD